MPTKGKTIVRFKDYDSEESSFSVRSAIMTALNFDSEETDLAAFLAGVDGITLGERVGDDHANVELIGIAPSDNPLAQREIKWSVSYYDTATMQGYEVTIPTADLAQLDPEDRAHAHIGDAGVVDAFVAAFEAYVRSPTGGIVVVSDISAVGRNV